MRKQERTVAPGAKPARRGARTKLRILDAAEREFAAHGFDGTSMRAIAAAAGGQLALIHYHFGSKLDVYRAVWARWFENPDMRQESIATVVAAGPEVLPDRLRVVVHSFFAPLFGLLDSPRGRRELAILGWELADPKAFSRGILDEFLAPVARLMLQQLHALMPGLSTADVGIGYQIMAATAQNVLMNSQRAIALSRGEISRSDLKSGHALLTDFVVAGWLDLHRRKSQRRKS